VKRAGPGRTRRRAAAPKGPRGPQRVRTLTRAEVSGLRTQLAHAAKPPGRWNVDPHEAQRSLAQLVLALVEFLRRLMERQAVRRMEAGSLTDAQAEDVGLALMRLEKTVRDLARGFGLDPDDLNLDLGPLGRLH
jgi:hypothetical protein